MEDRENLGTAFERTYNKLICQDDLGADEHAVYSNQEKQRGTVSDK